jgi:acyl carrier protein
MDANKFLKDFAEIFDNEPTEKITMDTRFKAIEEWSSLTALSIIAMADEKYNVKIKGDDVRNSQTIKDLYEIVKSRK